MCKIFSASSAHNKYFDMEVRQRTDIVKRKYKNLHYWEVDLSRPVKFHVPLKICGIILENILQNVFFLKYEVKLMFDLLLTWLDFKKQAEFFLKYMTQILKELLSDSLDSSRKEDFISEPEKRTTF